MNRTGAASYRATLWLDSSPAIVFGYFIDPSLLTRWIGDSAFLDARPGGELAIFFEDMCIAGSFLALEPPRRLVVSWGRRGSKTMPPATTTLTVVFASDAGGTRLTLEHDGLPESERLRHSQAWAHYLARLRQLGEGREPAAHVTPRRFIDGAE